MIRRFYHELVLGGHMLALGTASIAAASALLLGEGPTPALLVMAYLFSYGAYMMNRGSEMAQDALSNPERTAYLAGRGRFLPAISGACFVAGYAIAATVNPIFFGALLLPLILSLLYSVGSRRLLGVVGAARLKEKLMVKNVTISLGWSLIPVLVGLYYLNLEPVILVMGLFIFLRLMVNTLLFDIRDAEGDRLSGIRTVPTVFGTRRTYLGMDVIDLVTAAYLISAIALNLLPHYTVVLLSLPAYSLIYRQIAQKKRARLNLICDLLADGEYLLWGPLLYIGRLA